MPPKKLLHAPGCKLNGVKLPCVVFPLRVMAKLLDDESKKVLFCEPLAASSAWSSSVVFLYKGSVTHRCVDCSCAALCNDHTPWYCTVMTYPKEEMSLVVSVEMSAEVSACTSELVKACTSMDVSA